VETLQWIEDVHHVVERILFEIALRHFSSEADERLEIDICEFEQVVELEDLVHQKLQAWLIEDLVEVEGIERRHVDSVEGHLKMLNFHIN